MLTIQTFIAPPLETNCYLVADCEAGEALLIDAPWQIAARVQEAADARWVAIGQIICTHGHWDHMMGHEELIDATGARIGCHAMDAFMLEHPSFAPFTFPFTVKPVKPDFLLHDGDTVALGNHLLTVMHTPGHTPGGICLYAEADGVVFTGDTLFAGSYGRLDLPGGDPEQMVQSLLRLSQLPAATRVMPGHGPETTIGHEKWLAYAEEVEW